MESAATLWSRCIIQLLHASHRVEPSDLVDMINKTLRPTGTEVTVYLVDREQLNLRALPRGGRCHAPPLAIDTTVAGRAFSTMLPVAPPGQSDRLWVPIVDGSDRIGVLEMTLPDELTPDDPTIRVNAERVASVVGYLIVAKDAYGDTIQRTRRSRPMSTEGELLWRALPPLTFATPEISLAAVLEPCYLVGGDAFDYAIDHHRLHLGVFDAIGHGLSAALTSTLTLAATRAARTAGRDLPALASAADEAINSQFRDTRYTTAILAELDGDTGVVRYLNAGHPPAVVIRDGKAVDALDATPRPPLGVRDAPPPTNPPRPAEYPLQPGDRLLFYTDGITEARDGCGDFFGLPRLLDLTERHHAAGLPAPETLRRLSMAVMQHQNGQLADDATLLILEWSPIGTERP